MSRPSCIRKTRAISPRRSSERQGERPMRTPFTIYKRIGEMSYMRPEFAQRVRERFIEKKKELDEQSGR